MPSRKSACNHIDPKQHSHSTRLERRREADRPTFLSLIHTTDKPPVPYYNGRMAHILVVDDSTSVLEVLDTVLREAGHRVTVSQNGHKASQVLQSEVVDLLITDVYMPDGDGLELITEVCRHFPGTPVIAMSGITGKLDMLSVAELLGARCTLHKPFSKTELLDAVALASGGRSPA